MTGKGSVLVEVPVPVVVAAGRRIAPIVVVGMRGISPVVVRPIVPGVVVVVLRPLEAVVVVEGRSGGRVVERCRVVLVRPPMLLLNRIFGVRSAEGRSREERGFVVQRVDLLVLLVLLRQRALLVSMPLVSAHDAGWRLLLDRLDAELVHRPLHGVHLGSECHTPNQEFWI